MILWRGRLRFRTYNPGKLAKYGIQAILATAEGKKLEESIFSVLEPHLDIWHHVCQDDCYTSVENAEKLLLRKARILGTIRASRGIPKALVDFSKKLKRYCAICHQEGDVLLYIWRDKREVCMISTIYNGTVGEVTNKFGERKKKPNFVIQYKFIKNVDPADQYLSDCTILKKHKVEQIFALANQLCIIQSLSSVQVAEPRIKTEVQIIST
jgi:hypothetical protein